ncbi:MAG: hypothetical protein IJB88_03600 [Clostridia bacterium]|nr:hypothetical protein [Clostridia bacterium]
MGKTYMIKEEFEEKWRARIKPEVYERFMRDGFIIDDVVEVSRDWDVALQLVLNEVKIIKEEA